MRTKELPETMCENQSRALWKMHASCLSVGRVRRPPPCPLQTLFNSICLAHGRTSTISVCWVWDSSVDLIKAGAARQ